MFSPMRAVSLPSALPSSNAPVAAGFGGAASFIARSSRHASGRLAERREEEVEMRVRVSGAERDAQARGAGRYGGRTDRLDQQAPPAELGGRGTPGLRGARNDGGGG